MIYCPACGYPNDDQEHRCERCGRRFDGGGPRPLAAVLWPDPDEENEARPGASPEGREKAPSPPFAEEPPAMGGAEAGVYAGQAAVPPRWRQELSSRVERFRERRRLQASLPFDEAAAAADPLPPLPPLTGQPVSARGGKLIPFDTIRGARAVVTATAHETVLPITEVPETSSRPSVEPPATPPAEKPRGEVPAETAWGEARGVPPPAVPPKSRPRQAPLSRRMGAGTGQSSLAFPDARSQPPWSELEVRAAPLLARALAGAADAALLACSLGAFFLTYWLCGGRFPLTRVGITAFAGAALCLAFGYIFLSLYYGAATAGMAWFGLRLATFEGRPARRDQRLLRALCLVPSALAVGLGFIWATVDEERLTWHDRMSGTCLTASR